MGVNEIHGPDIFVAAVEDVLPAEHCMVALVRDEGDLELHSLQVLDVPPLEEFLPSHKVLAGEEGAAIHKDLAVHIDTKQWTNKGGKLIN